jgi:DNA processing protein
MFDGPLPREIDPKERLARLRLARSPRIGAVTFHEALGHFGSARAACAELSTISALQAEREQEPLARLGAQFIVWGDAGYPAALAALPDAPPVLAAIGDLSLLARPALAIVGAREASLAGRRFAAEMAAALGAAGFVIVSGLARGIDAAAHEAALATAPWPCWPAASTRSTRRRMPGCTSGSRPKACCWPNRRWARHPSPAPSHAAIALSAGFRPVWW